MRKYLFLILLSLLCCSCVTRKTIEQTLATTVTQTERDSSSTSSVTNNVKVSQRTDSVSTSENTIVMEHVTDSVIITEHADGTRDVYRSRHVEKDRQSAKEKQKTTIVNDSTSTDKTNSMYISKETGRDSTFASVNNTEVVKEKTSFKTIVIAGLAAILLFVLVVVAGYIWIKKK